MLVQKGSGCGVKATGIIMEREILEQSEKMRDTKRNAGLYARETRKKRTRNE